MTDDSQATPEEQRALTKEELAFADQARQPALGRLSDKALTDLIGLLRMRRNRARDIAARQGREVRGKTAPKGANPAGGNEGTRSKSAYLSAALDRAVAERERREAGDAPTQAELAEKAAQMTSQVTKDAAAPTQQDGTPPHPADPDADPGNRASAATARDTAPSGALDHAGALPARERSRERG